MTLEELAKVISLWCSVTTDREKQFLNGQGVEVANKADLTKVDNSLIPNLITHCVQKLSSYSSKAGELNLFLQRISNGNSGYHFFSDCLAHLENTSRMSS